MVQRRVQVQVVQSARAQMRDAREMGTEQNRTRLIRSMQSICLRTNECNKDR